MYQGGRRLTGFRHEITDGKPLITIITAVFNGDTFIEKAIKSVIAQTYTNIEYIIIDGCSTDNTLDIIKKYDGAIDYWISEKDNGIYDAFNKGLAKSTGELIGFLNSDDWYEPDGLQKIIDEVKPFPAIYCGNMNLCQKDGILIKLHKSRPDRLFQTMRIAHPATLVSSQIFDEIGKFSTDYRIAGDYDFFLRAKLRGFEIFTIDKLISNMLLGGKSCDLKMVFKEELLIKNRNLGNKIQHWIWYYLNIIIYAIKSSLQKLTKQYE